MIGKLLSVDRLQSRLKFRRSRGARIVLANGCFDGLHAGHRWLLAEAAGQGDCLVVGINSDRSVRQLKGAGRPLLKQEERAVMLATLACVDYVTIFEETSVANLVATLRPQVLVKGAEYSREQVVGRNLVENNGGRVVLVEMLPGYSTTLQSPPSGNG